MLYTWGTSSVFDLDTFAAVHRFLLGDIDLETVKHRFEILVFVRLDAVLTQSTKYASSTCHPVVASTSGVSILPSVQ